MAKHPHKHARKVETKPETGPEAATERSPAEIAAILAHPMPDPDVPTYGRNPETDNLRGKRAERVFGTGQ